MYSTPKLWPPITFSICRFICLSGCLSVCLSVCLYLISTQWAKSNEVCRPHTVCLHGCLASCWPVCLSVRRSVRLSMCMNLSACLSARVSVCCRLASCWPGCLSVQVCKNCQVYSFVVSTCDFVYVCVRMCLYFYFCVYCINKARSVVRQPA